MSDLDPKPHPEFDDLEPMPAEAELAELPDEAMLPEMPEEAELEPLEELVELEELPAAAEPQVVKPVVKPVVNKPQAAKTPAPKPVPAVKPATAAKQPTTTMAKTAAVQSDSGDAPAAKPPAAARVSKPSGQKRAPREAKPKHNPWERWTGPGDKPKRAIEAAPAVLRKAALGLFISCLLPWGGITPDWVGNIGEKLLVLGALFVWHQTNALRDGLPVSGFIAKLGAKTFIPLFVLAGVLLVVGILPIFSYGNLSLENAGPFSEKGFLVLAGLTLSHIRSYEYGGKFNPLYPMIFMAPAIAGVMGLIRSFGAESIGPGEIIAGLGAVGVAAAGSMAAYTMYVAIKEANAHGKAKKIAQAEARKEARKAGRS